jgi:MFS family permease
MGEFAKQFAIYVGLLLMCMNYTIIAPFYPKVAQSKDIPVWMIGVIFALYPFFKLLATPFVGKYMQRIGRKKIVMASFVLVSLSLFVLSPIEYVDRTTVIILSILSRMFGGLGACCMFTSFTTIFISDYPDKMQLMIGRMEAAVGVGLMMGPILGTALYYINLMAAMVGVGSLIIFFAPFANKMLGNFRDYNVTEVNIDRTSLFFKPVKLIRKLFLAT